MTKVVRALSLCLLLSTAIMAPLVSSAQSDGSSIWDRLNEIQQAYGQEAANAQFAELSPEDQQAVIDYMLDTTTTEEGVSIQKTESQNNSLTAACWQATQSIVVKQSWTGVVFYRYHQYMYWCGNGSSPYNRSCSAWPSDTGWGYWFDSHITYCQLSPQGYYFNYFSQGKFCAGAYFCQITGTPWIRQNGGASGEYWSSYGY